MKRGCEPRPGTSGRAVYTDAAALRQALPKGLLGVVCNSRKSREFSHFRRRLQGGRQGDGPAPAPQGQMRACSRKLNLVDSWWARLAASIAFRMNSKEE